MFYYNYYIILLIIIIISFLLLSEIIIPIGQFTDNQHCVASPKMFYHRGIGYNGAKTDCGIAHLLGILLTNSYDLL